MKFLVYILLFQFSFGALIPKTDFNQFSKLPDLLDHYQLHAVEAQENGDDFSVLDFIYLHYISPDDHTHGEPFDHSKLPFKSINAIVLACNTDVQFECKQEEFIMPECKWSYFISTGKTYVPETYVPPIV